MVSPKQAAANKANAQRSTGPRSGEGKSRSRANAIKHGLAVPASALPELAPEIARLARILAGPAADHSAVYQAATRVAEAAIDLLVIGAVWGAKPQIARATRIARGGILG
jgi:hypothetical protein